MKAYEPLPVESEDEGGRSPGFEIARAIACGLLLIALASLVAALVS